MRKHDQRKLAKSLTKICESVGRVLLPNGAVIGKWRREEQGEPVSVKSEVNVLCATDTGSPFLLRREGWLGT